MRAGVPKSLVVTLALLACPDACPPPSDPRTFPQFSLPATKRYTYEDMHALLAGGTRAAVLARDGSGLPLANANIESTSDGTLHVDSRTDESGLFTVTTGDAGSSDLTYVWDSGVCCRSQPTRVRIMEATALQRQEAEYVSAPLDSAVLTGTRVSLAVTPMGDSKTPLFGTGRVTFELSGALRRLEAPSILGENRVFFSAEPIGGGGSVRAVLGSLEYVQPIGAVGPDGLVITIEPGNEWIKDSPKRHVLVTVRAKGTDVLVHGGSCYWTPTFVEVDDHTELERLEEPRRYAWLTVPRTGAVTVTCTIGTASASYELR